MIGLIACEGPRPDRGTDYASEREIQESPLTGPRSGNLTVDLVLGASDSVEEYTFGQLRDVLLLADGGFIILDALPNVARRYDRSGTFIANIGREGDGPGEYRGASMLAAAEDHGRLFLANETRGTIYVYGLDGTPIDTWELERPLDYPLIVDTSGVLVVRFPDHLRTRGRWSIEPHVVDSLPNYIAIVRRNGHSTDPPGLIWVDSTGSTLDSVRVTFEERLDAYVALPRGRIYSVIDYLPFNWWSWTADNRLVKGRTDLYEITIFNQYAAGEPSTPSAIAGRAIPPVSIGPAERAIIDQLLPGASGDWERSSGEWHGPQEAPHTKPFYHRVLHASDGKLWVMRQTPSDVEPSLEGRTAFHEHEGAFDVFEPDGRFVGSLSAPRGLDPRSIRGDTVLAIIRGAFGVDLVQRLVAVWQ
jgi:hypothetical protein